MRLCGENWSGWAWRTKPKPSAFLLLCIACSFVLAFTGCQNQTSEFAERMPVGRDSAPANATGRAGFSPPAAGELQQLLQEELSRLGKDAKTPASVPTGSTNVVFDLTASVVESGGQPTGVELKWTERLLGDYDQNGQASLADLASLGMNWQRTVAYDAPALHGGITFWPTGDPADGATGAANWRLARIDGNGDGVLDTKDVSPLGQHWMEHLSGYRVYRKGPGESNFAMLPGVGGDTQLTLARPTSTPVDVPARYGFTDLPPVAGQYEYYVTAMALPQGEADARSNTATADLSAGFTDTQPPQWQGGAGIAGVVPNADGTVTVSWGAATDIAAPPAPASPPVTYTVYYSTQTPIDFGTAAKAAGLTASPWMSPQLVVGTQYHFAVRAVDSAAPKPNEDANTTELAATPSGGPVEDHDPPVWTMQNLDGNTISGIYSIAANDGELVITCADASDALTPPVHYDLYYISGREPAAKYLNYFQPLDLPAGYHVISDIPKTYHFAWENRHKVYLAITARDSADPPNTANNVYWIQSAPADVERIPMDPTIPGYDPVTQKMRYSVWAYEPEQHLIYKVYAFSLKDQEPYNVWFVTINGDTGKMQGHYVMSGSYKANMVPLKLARSWTGELWFEARSERPRSMYRRRLDGLWEPWEVDVPSEWQRQFDQNGLPAFFTSETSDVQSGRSKLLYHWYDEAFTQWRTELISDPGGGMYSTTHHRSDGVLQIISVQDLAMPDDVTPKYARVFERFPDGHLVNVITAVGYISDVSGANNVLDTWDAQWAWSASTNIHGSQEFMVYGAEGFEYLPNPDVDNSGWPITGEKVWPASGGGWHLLPYYIRTGGELLQYETYLPNYLAAPVNSDPNNQIGYMGFFAEGGTVYNPKDGFFARTARDYDLATGRMQASMIKPAHGKTIFVP